MFGGVDQTSLWYPTGVSSALLPGDFQVFLLPFSPSLWLLAFGTTVVVTVILWLMEVKLDKVISHPRAAALKYQKLQFATVGLLLQGWVWRVGPK